ncbi:Detected protein of unknown function [Hibiscus syriacus]|uniref:DUF7086 domain-containing protein n=1 Tax=Hibiscus syriacus TaxID=106335 RepID=A0A6A3ADV9_HIBSY|nr:Detected protein of unknown function [Hibiscus syriacus]
MGDEQDDNLELSLSISPRPSSRAPPVAVTLPVTVSPRQETRRMVSLPSPVQTLLYESPTSHPLQLSANHSLYAPPEEIAFSPSPADVPRSGTITGAGPSRNVRNRRNTTTNAPRKGKSETIEPPYPWATNHRATVHDLQHLLSNGIRTITGDVKCKRCERQYQMEFDLIEKFTEIGGYIARNKHSMHDRAPPVWRNPVLPKCRFCGQENSAKPVISAKKKAINWLFLLLGQMIGCCTLEHLKYFCKHTNLHRTAAKIALFISLIFVSASNSTHWPF